MSEKIKVLSISDHPLSPSGVGTQTKYMVEALLETGKFKFVSLAGAIRHNDYTPQKTEEWGDDWTIYPVNGYGDPDLVRGLIRQEKPDILWFMTDPRFYEWLWLIENEIRPNIPMVYYHVWDNYPYPTYNKKFYDSNDVIACISKVTHDIVKNVSPDVESLYLPHAVDMEIFKNYNKEEDEDIKTSLKQAKKLMIGSEEDSEKMIFFWNNRNARRKQTGTLIWWFKEFLDKIGHDKACLVLHTDPKDENGQDLEAILGNLNLKNGEIRISVEKVPPLSLAMMYSTADCTVNISDAEGFGLGTLESLACETPIIVNMTGGLQEQVTDGEQWFGVGIEPASKAIIGSQTVPFIYEDRLNKDDFVNALEEVYDAWKNNPEKYKKWSETGREHLQKNYNFKDFRERWINLMLDLHERYGSWENRKNYKHWQLKSL